MALSKKDQYKFEHGELKIIDSGYADNKEDYEYYRRNSQDLIVAERAMICGLCGTKTFALKKLSVFSSESSMDILNLTDALVGIPLSGLSVGTILPYSSVTM